MNTERLSDVTCCWCSNEDDAGVWAFCFWGCLFFGKGGGGGDFNSDTCCTLATEAIDVTVTLTKIVLVVNATFL